MIFCPYCDSENIAGVDACEHCGQPLSELHLPQPASHLERSLLRDRLSTIPPHRPVVTVAPDAAVGEVVKLMADKAIGCAIVVEDDKLVGIFSERDVLMKVNTQFSELADQPVSKFMTSSPQSLDGRAKVTFALHRMAVGHFRHVPITDSDSRPSAIISVRDVLRYLTEKLAESDA